MNNQPTTAQWGEIEQQLGEMFRRVYLQCDGYLVFACLERTSAMRLGVLVYVDGYFRGKWLISAKKESELCDEARRFLMPRRRMFHTKAQLKLYEHLYGKRDCRKRGYYDPIIYPSPYWISAKSLIRHLRKHNQDIEILSASEYERRLAEKKEIA